MTKEIVCFDVETTGINQQTNHIIQLSMIKFNSTTFEVLVEKNWYIKPELDFTIEPQAQETHGITKEFILEHGFSLRSIFPEIEYILGDCDVLTYNGNTFDNSFLYNDLKELGLEIDYNRKFYDAYVIECKRNSRKLCDVFAKYTNQTMEEAGLDAHNALSDVKATIEVFKRQQKVCSQDIEQPEFNMVSPEGFLMTTPEETVMFAKGKYSRKNVVDVCKEDPGYIKWLFDQCSKVTKKTIMNEYYKVYPKKL